VHSRVTRRVKFSPNGYGYGWALPIGYVPVAIVTPNRMKGRRGLPAVGPQALSHYHVGPDPPASDPTAEGPTAEGPACLSFYIDPSAFDVPGRGSSSRGLLACYRGEGELLTVMPRTHAWSSPMAIPDLCARTQNIRIADSPVPVHGACLPTQAAVKHLHVLGKKTSLARTRPRQRTKAGDIFQPTHDLLRRRLCYSRRRRIARHRLRVLRFLITTPISTSSLAQPAEEHARTRRGYGHGDAHRHRLPAPPRSCCRLRGATSLAGGRPRPRLVGRPGRREPRPRPRHLRLRGRSITQLSPRQIWHGMARAAATLRACSALL
jgi:hypothetical protein